MFLDEFLQKQYRACLYSKAQEIPPADCSVSLHVRRAFKMIANTAPFRDGLPAMSVPCGLSEGLPIGLTLMGSK